MYFGWDRKARMTHGAGWETLTPCGIQKRAGLAGALFLALSASSAMSAEHEAGQDVSDLPLSSKSAVLQDPFAETHASGQLWAPFSVDALFRQRPETTPGLQTSVGSFLVLGSVLGSATYNANLSASPGAPRSDVHMSLLPEVRATSQWSRHSLELFAGGEARVYGSHNNEDQANVFAGLNGTIDVYHDLRVQAQARCALWHEERGYGDSFSPYTSPIQAETCSTAASIDKEFNRVSISVGGSVRSDSYENPTLMTNSGLAPVDQSFRSGQTYESVGRVGYELTDNSAIFVESAYNWREYANTSFNSDGYRLLGGVRFDITEVISGELAGGWLHENYSSLARNTVDTFSYRGQMVWRPDELVNVAVVGGRRLGDPSMFYGGSSTLITEVGFLASYAWRSDVQLTGAVGYEWLDYVDQLHTDELIRAHTAINYQIDSNINLSLNYEHEEYLGRPSALAADYGRDSITLSLTARY